MFGLIQDQARKGLRVELEVLWEHECSQILWHFSFILQSILCVNLTFWKNSGSPEDSSRRAHNTGVWPSGDHESELLPECVLWELLERRSGGPRCTVCNLRTNFRRLRTSATSLTGTRPGESSSLVFYPCALLSLALSCVFCIRLAAHLPSSSSAPSLSFQILGQSSRHLTI